MIVYQIIFPTITLYYIPINHTGFKKRDSIETALDSTDSILFNLDNHRVIEMVTVDYKKAFLKYWD